MSDTPDQPPVEDVPEPHEEAEARARRRSDRSDLLPPPGSWDL